jgi:hypothetical protein
MPGKSGLAPMRTFDSACYGIKLSIGAAMDCYYAFALCKERIQFDVNQPPNNSYNKRNWPK